MQCMKCGRDTEPEQVFCEMCRETMAKYPVKPGTVVQLPRRPQQVQKKQPVRRRPMLSPEEQINLLRRLARRQIALILLLLAAVIGLSWLSVKLYLDGEKKVLPGQNYSAATVPAESTEPETTEPETQPPAEFPEYGVAG